MAIQHSEFSEFSFGYALTDCFMHLRKVRSLIPKPYIAAPFFPTQIKEKELGFDVAFASLSKIFILQFKRAKFISSNHKNLEENKKGYTTGTPVKLPLPFYRVDFPSQGDRDQRKTLKALEDSLKAHSFAKVRYAAPAFHKNKEINKFYQDGLSTTFRTGTKPRRSVIFFKASDFDLPGSDPHHISYTGCDSLGYRFSFEVLPMAHLDDFLTTYGEETPGQVVIHSNEIRKIMDSTAQELGFPDVQREMNDEDILGLFGINFHYRREAPIGSAMFLMDKNRVGLIEYYLDLAKYIRELLDTPMRMNFPEDRYLDRTTLSVIQDIFVSDLRCRQMTGGPLLLG